MFNDNPASRIVRKFFSTPNGVKKQGTGISKGLFERIATYQRPRERINPQLRCPICERSSCESGLTGPLFSNRASLSLPCGVWGGQLGKEDLSAKKSGQRAGVEGNKDIS